MAKGRAWTPSEDGYLRANYARDGDAGVGRHLGRSADAVRNRVRVLGLTKPRGAPARPWSAAETFALRQLVREGMTNPGIARRLGRAPYAVQAMRARLGLAPHQKGTRRRLCLRCARPFASEGAHNRVCAECKATDEWRAGGIMARPEAALPKKARAGRG